MIVTTPLSQEILALLEEELPSFFSRVEAPSLLRGMFARETLANLEHTGKGPPVHYMGRKAYYVKTEFLSWMSEYYGGMTVEHEGFSRVLRAGKGPETPVGSGSEGSLGTGEPTESEDASGDVSTGDDINQDS